MTELRPLLSSSEDELELALLGSAREDLPSGAALRDAALALGLAAATGDALAAGLPTASTVLSQHAAASTTAVAGGTSTAAAIGSASLGMLGKSVLGGALVSFLALTTIEGTTRSTAPRPGAASSSHVARQANPPRVAPVAVTSALQPQATVTPPPSPATPPSVSKHVPARSSTPEQVAIIEPQKSAARAAFAPIPAETRAQAPARQQSASLAAETQWLDQARAALRSGNPSQAAQALNSYTASRPGPVLAQEAAFLRVQLLIAQGQRAAAVELARQILAQHPESAHVESLRRLATER